MKRSIIPAMIIAALIAAPACRFGETRGEEKSKETTEAPVETTGIEIDSISSFIQASTVIKAERSVDVYSEISEEVTAVYAEEGDYIAEGRVLAELDDEDLKILEQKARINYEKLKADLRRVERMFDKDLISDDEYENAEYSVTQARLEWEQASLNLSRTKIKATIGGVVSMRNIEEGERVNAGIMVFSLVDMSRLTTEAFIPEKDVKNVEKGQTVRVESESLGEAKPGGEVIRISPVVDPDTGTVKVTAEIEEGGELLKPGMFVNLRIITETHPEAMLIPKKALVYENENDYVFTTDGEYAYRIDVETGFEDGRRIEVLSPLEKDDRVIVVGQNGLKDGVPVKVAGTWKADRQL